MGISKPTNDEENLHDYVDLTSRIKRTLYYDPIKEPDKDTLSYSATESVVTHFREVAPMPIGKLGHRYASRVARDACISPCAMLLGLIYIERLKNKNPKYLENVSSSELFLVSMMVSSKYLYDEGCDDEVFNDEWALSGDVDVKRVNDLERDFLRAIDWHLYVHPHEFSSILNVAETDVALANGGKRGWLTYCDLTSVLNSQKVTCYCAIIYSGLVCVTALTSVALVAVSSKSHGKPFGPLMKSSTSHPTTNSSENDHPASEEMFSSSCDFRKINRQRTVSVHENSDMFLKQPKPVIDDVRLPSLNTGATDDKVIPTSSKEDGCSISTFVEAIVFMANVPHLCLQNRKISTDKCPKCGNSNKKYDDRHFKCFGTKFKKVYNCSMYSESFIGKRLDPHVKPNTHREYCGPDSSMTGIFNPTVPPPSNLPAKLKHLSAIATR